MRSSLTGLPNREEDPTESRLRGGVCGPKEAQLHVGEVGVPGVTFPFYPWPQSQHLPILTLSLRDKGGSKDTPKNNSRYYLLSPDVPGSLPAHNCP